MSKIRTKKILKKNFKSKPKKKVTVPKKFKTKKN